MRFSPYALVALLVVPSVGFAQPRSRRRSAPSIVPPVVVEPIVTPPSQEAPPAFVAAAPPTPSPAPPTAATPAAAPGATHHWVGSLTGGYGGETHGLGGLLRLGFSEGRTTRGYLGLVAGYQFGQDVDVAASYGISGYSRSRRYWTVGLEAGAELHAGIFMGRVSVTGGMLTVNTSCEGRCAVQEGTKNTISAGVGLGLYLAGGGAFVGVDGRFLVYADDGFAVLPFAGLTFGLQTQ